MTGFTWFDLTVAGLMLISGLLALMRGFTREITSMVAWGAAIAAAIAAAYTPELVAQAQIYISEEWLARAAVGGITFLIVLLILSLISIRFTDWLLDSSPGAFDRTLGFFYGLVRGLALIVILYSFYIFFIPQKSHFEGIRQARSLLTVESVALKMYEFFPAQFSEQAKNLTELTYTHTRKATPVQNNSKGDNQTGKSNYKSGDKKVLDQLIQNTQKAPKSDGTPKFGTDNNGQN